MEINIPTGQDVLRDIAIQYVNKAFVYITGCNPPLKYQEQSKYLTPFSLAVVRNEHELQFMSRKIRNKQSLRNFKLSCLLIVINRIDAQNGLFNLV